MKHFITKIAAFCLLFMSLYMMLPICSEAADKINTKANVTFTLFHKVDNKAVKDVEYSIYRVGDLSESGKVEFSKDFKKYSLKLNMSNNSAVKSTADALQGYILRDKIKPLDSALTDANGVVVFPTNGSLKTGLYLICGKSYKTADGKICNIQPILTALPVTDGEGTLWYDVKVESKHEILQDTSKLSVLKVWKDKTTHYRPNKIQVQLINTVTGEIHDTVNLSKSNNWRHSWSNLPAGYTWTVVEKDVPEHYTLSVKRDKFTIELTNSCDKTYTPPKEPDKETTEEETDDPVTQTPHSPQTGGSTSTKLPQTGTLWWPVPILVIAGMLCILIGMLRKRGQNEI